MPVRTGVVSEFRSKGTGQRIANLLQRSGSRAATLTGLLWLAIATVAHAAAPLLLHTPGYESPVRGDPDDLLMIPGTGFHATDQVIYRAMDSTQASAHTKPLRNTAESGLVPIVRNDSPAYALTVRLPSEMQTGRAYRLWVVTHKNEWSEPVSINDPRAQWITPGYVYSTAAIPGLGRVVRIVGRNLETSSGKPLEVRLQSRPESKESSYTLASQRSPVDSEAVRNYVLTAALPMSIAPGFYSVAVRREGLGWVEIPDQQLEVRADPSPLPVFSLDDPAYGGCHPDDSKDDSSCLARAIEAAGNGGGGVVRIPPGHWDVTTTSLGVDGFQLPPGVHLRGAGPEKSFVLRHGRPRSRSLDALFTLTGHNSVVGLSFSDELRFESPEQARPVIELGPQPNVNESHDGRSHVVDDIVISDNIFLHVGSAITDAPGHPIARLIVTANVMGGYWRGIELPGSPTTVWEPFRIDDSVVRGNRFIPGSYMDLSIKQGVLASGMGAGHRVDFSANIADGTSTAGLQDPDDQRGFRAAFFWNMNNSVELTLVSQNQVLCSGDKVGDGEAIALDGSGDTYGFEGAPEVTDAGPDWVVVRGKLKSEQARRAVPDTYYNGHWIQVVSGPGLGQTRKISSYTQDEAHSRVTLHVTPAWDIIPGGPLGRIGVQRQYWQMLIVGNSIQQSSPPCRKSNLTAPNGGEIGIWTPAADLVIEANRQWDTDGIQFAPAYTVTAPSCPRCGNSMFFQTALEIRGNRVEGEYDWSSDCSNGGIRGVFGASATPESPPPVLGFGISISHNNVVHADAYRGGGIDIPLISYPGPPPGNWPFIENLLIFHNQLSDLDGQPPDTQCHRGQRERSGIRLEGHDNIRHSVLYGNRCERVATPLVDSGLGTLKLCSGNSHGNCECPGS